MPKYPLLCVSLFCLLGHFAEASVEERALVDGALVLRGKTLNEYYQLYQDPFVKGVREYLDRFLKGKLKADNVAVAGIQSDHSDGLSNFDKDYYKSKFIVITVEPFLGGGQTVSIIFQDKPDKMFDVWMFPLSGGTIEMRAFVQDKDATEGEIKKLYRNFISDPNHNL